MRVRSTTLNPDRLPSRVVDDDRLVRKDGIRISDGIIAGQLWEIPCRTGVMFGDLPKRIPLVDMVGYTP